MAEETHRSSAAEISVTSNGDLDQSPETVFQRVRAHLEFSYNLIHWYLEEQHCSEIGWCIDT